jgi:hypothetical protein
VDSARLLVERGAIRNSSEDWGEYAFVSLPSPGDRIAAKYEGTIHYLTVICVHHKAYLLNDDAPAPAAEVVTKWTSSD